MSALSAVILACPGSLPQWRIARAQPSRLQSRYKCRHVCRASRDAAGRNAGRYVEDRRDGSFGRIAGFVGVTVVCALAVFGRQEKRAYAAPPVVERVSKEQVEEADKEREMEELQMALKIREAFGLEERLSSFEAKIGEREEEYRKLLGVEELESLVKSYAGRSPSEVQQMLDRASDKLRLEARSLQAKVLVDLAEHLAKLQRQELPLMKQFRAAADANRKAKTKLEVENLTWEEIEEQSHSDSELREFVDGTRDLREKLKAVVAASLASEYEGWSKAYIELPEFVLKVEAQLLQAVKLPEGKAENSAVAVANELKETAKNLWKEGLLPLAADVKVPVSDRLVSKEVRSEVNGMLQNHLRLADEAGRKGIPVIDNDLGSVEMYTAFDKSPRDVPKRETLKTIFGWKKWCGIKREELKQRLLDNPELGKQVVRDMQKKLLTYRDRVLAHTMYNTEHERWEMSHVGAVYALDKKLVEQVRIRHDNRVLLLSLKGEDIAYTVYIEDLDTYLEDSGGFDAFYAILKASGVPVTREEMPIPVSEWSALDYSIVPLHLGWRLMRYLYDTPFVKGVRSGSVEFLTDVAEESMVRLADPVLQRLPLQVRVNLGFELPEGLFAEPTERMQWLKDCKGKVESRQSGLPWWVAYPLRLYVVAAPVVLVTSWIWKIIWRIVGPEPFPETKFEITVRQQERALKAVLPRVKKITRDPVKRVFNEMKRIRNPSIRLKDFVGIETFGPEITEIVTFLRNPAVFKKLGARPPRGVLIVGETGTGKTTLARAIAAEARVPVVEIRSYDIKGGGDWVGQKAANVRELFKTARQFAPIILFMDDFDEFVGKRGETANKDTQEQESLINQFLVELDGFETRDGVLLLATTSHPERIDEAIRRPGRMDRTIALLPPSRSQREEMLRQIAKDTMHPVVRDWVNWAEIADKTEGFSYLDLQCIPNDLHSAIMGFKVADNEELSAMLFLVNIYSAIVPSWIRRTFLNSWDQKLVDFFGIRPEKREVERIVRYLDVRGAAKPGIELFDPMYEWTREFKYGPAVWAAGRGLVGLLLPDFDTVDILWLDRTSWNGIAFTKLTRKADEGYMKADTVVRSYLEKQLVLLHGSYAAFQLLLPSGRKDNNTKAQLDEAAGIAAKMVLQYGWSLDDSPVVYVMDSLSMLDTGKEEEVLARSVTELLEAARDRAFEIVKRNKHILEAFVERLVQHDCILAEEMEVLLREHNAIFEQDPFTLQGSSVSSSERTLKGTPVTV